MTAWPGKYASRLVFLEGDTPEALVTFARKQQAQGWQLCIFDRMKWGWWVQCRKKVGEGQEGADGEEAKHE